MGVIAAVLLAARRNGQGPIVALELVLVLVASLLPVSIEIIGRVLLAVRELRFRLVQGCPLRDVLLLKHADALVRYENACIRLWAAHGRVICDIPSTCSCS